MQAENLLGNQLHATLPTGVECLPTFTKPPRQCRGSIAADLRQRLLSNVWCGLCRHEASITNFSGAIKDGNFLLEGKCAECYGQECPEFAPGQCAQILGVDSTRYGTQLRQRS